MPNHVHLILVPEDGDGLRRALAQALRRAESVGRRLGDAGFLDRLEALTGSRLKRRKPGPKPE